MWKKLQQEIGTAWCVAMHDSVMWPAHGEYECRSCGRRYAAFVEAPVVGRVAGTLEVARPLDLQSRNSLA
jgi:hypothetical protein